jgi:hypothetical protein
MPRIPSPPKDLSDAGRKLWRAIMADFEVQGAELMLVTDACVLADRMEALRPMLKLGPLMKGPDGLPRPNPADQQFRLLVIAKARLLAAAQVAGEVRGEKHDPARPQKHAGIRGVHALRAVQ